MLSNLSDPVFIMGLTSNLTALYLVVTKSRKELFEYKKLLIIFLISDLLYTIMQDLFRPIFAVRQDLFIGFLPGPIQNKLFLSIYCGLISMSFVIFAMHFMFRALAISSKSYFAIQLNRKRLTIICVILLSEWFIWALICQLFLDYEPSYEAAMKSFFDSNNLEIPSNPYHSIFIFKAYRTDGTFYTEKFLVILSFMAMVLATFAAIVVSSFRIIRALVKRGASSKMWRKFHLQLFIALLVQLSIPCVLLYFPCSFYLLSPFLNSDRVNTPTWLLTTLYSIYPILDPLAIIFMISDYRREVFRLVRWLTFKELPTIEPVGAVTFDSTLARRQQTSERTPDAFNLQAVIRI